MPPELVKGFATDGGVVFVGAGLSMGAGLPSWSALMQPLRKELDDCCTPDTPLTDVALFYEIQKSRASLLQQLKTALNTNGRRPTSAHRALMGLPVRRIYTTNFDNLLELAAWEAGRSFDLVVNTPDLSLLTAESLQIVKVHGDLLQAQSVTVTSRDYELFAQDKSGLANLLKLELQTQLILFLGYSFSDHDLRVVLRQAHAEGGPFPKNRFILSLNKTSASDLMFRSLGLTPIYPDEQHGPDTERMTSWLEAFGREIQEARRAPVVIQNGTSDARKSHNLPPPLGTFVGRGPELEKVLTGLSSRYPLVVIEGFAGVGKTSLAIQAGYACALVPGPRPRTSVIFDFVVWISAKDKPDQTAWLNDVLDAVSITTGHSAISQFSSEETSRKISEVGQILSTQAVLIIIDNFETVSDEHLLSWLEAVPSPTKILVTTRNSQLHQKAYAVPIGGLDGPDALQFLQSQATQAGLDPMPSAQRLSDLAEVTGRNPQAMRLALGLVPQQGLTPVINMLAGEQTGQHVEPLFQGLFRSAWNLLEQPARNLLRTTPLFVGVGSIRRDALIATAGLKEEPFDAGRGIEQLTRLGLLEVDPTPPDVADEQRFTVHSMTRTFARSTWPDDSLFEPEARLRQSDYYMGLVDKYVLRKRPNVDYWNALVNDGMLVIDPDWPSIRENMRWSVERGDRIRVLSFTLKLIHYMDSRFHNNDRVFFVNQAIDVAKSQRSSYREALLRIDALGWTYGEERRFPEALAEIAHGLALAESSGESGQELSALGWAWRARVLIEEDRREEAEEWIKRAAGVETPPWIRCRVLMASGDIDLKLERCLEALSSYHEAARQARLYGDEGRGYQTKPRIGFAHLALGELVEAERVFQELTTFDDMEIAQLYGEYGLAMIASKRNEGRGAVAILESVRKRLLQRTSSNLLLNMTQRLEADLRL